MMQFRNFRICRHGGFGSVATSSCAAEQDRNRRAFPRSCSHRVQEQQANRTVRVGLRHTHSAHRDRCCFLWHSCRRRASWFVRTPPIIAGGSGSTGQLGEQVCLSVQFGSSETGTRSKQPLERIAAAEKQVSNDALNADSRSVAAPATEAARAAERIWRPHGGLFYINSNGKRVYATAE